MLNWIDTRSDSELAAAARDFFAAAFPDAPEPVGVWAAPGRVNLIGEHIDYAGGASIPFALEQNTAVAVAPRTDGLLRIASEFDGSVAQASLPLSEVRPGHPSDWSGYVAGTVWAATAADVLTCTGLDIAIVSDVPVGSGLSSSAALECSVAVAAYELCHGKAPDDAARAQLVQACIRAENEVVGASTGGLDQNASLFGQRGKALFLDFSTGAVERVPFNIEAQDMVLLIADTNAPHTLSDGQYASRRGIIDALSTRRPQPALNTPPAEITEPFTMMLYGITTEQVQQWLGDDETAEDGVITEADLDLPSFAARDVTADHTAAERAAIVEALRTNGGRVTETAKALKLSRATLYRKIKALKIALDG